MATYCKACGHYILSVKYNRRLSSGVTASVVYVRGHISCWRAVALNVTATGVFWRNIIPRSALSFSPPHLIDRSEEGLICSTICDHRPHPILFVNVFRSQGFSRIHDSRALMHAVFVLTWHLASVQG